MRIYGDLKQRIELNRNRLLSEEYKSPLIFKQGGEWPGDWQGRTILALTSLYQVTNHQDERNNIKEQLDNILNELPNHLNKDNYLGELINLKKVNEQQISGHSWFLRGLCEYYLLFKDEEIYKLIGAIKNNYLLKLKGVYKNYPLIEREWGRVDGHLLKKPNNGWLLSSDVGCAFILLDGMTQVYDIMPDETLEAIIIEMIEHFFTIDVNQHKFQTHATLTALRGVYRFYKNPKTKIEGLIKNIINVYDLYMNHGTTLNYANLNWFGIPSWTEICAVVDSYILANYLFKETNEISYIRTANRIFENAIISGHRNNGGAGCETCLINENDEFKMHLYEAYFCCTMRISEGFKEVVNHLIVPYKDSALITQLTMLENYNVNTNEFLIKKINDTFQVTVSNSSYCDFIYLYIPNYTKFKTSSKYNQTGNILKLWFIDGKVDIALVYSHYQEWRNNVKINLLGDKILTKKNDESSYTELLDSINYSEEELENIVQRL